MNPALPTCSGLNSFQGLGVAVDPVDPLRVLCNMGGSYASNRPYQRLYRWGGMTFGTRIIAGVTDSRRGTHSAMAYAPSSIGARRAETWLAIVDGRYESGSALVPIVASIDGWASWEQRGTWNQARFGASSWMRSATPRTRDASTSPAARGWSGSPMPSLSDNELHRAQRAGRPARGEHHGQAPLVSADGLTIIVGIERRHLQDHGRRCALEPGRRREGFRQAAG